MLEQVYSDYVYLRSTLSEPTEEPEVDKIDTYRLVVSALREARDNSYEMADSQGRTINRQRAVKCYQTAVRCESALIGLQKVAEL